MPLGNWEGRKNGATQVRTSTYYIYYHALQVMEVINLDFIQTLGSPY